jgi:microcompartment protein CcmL/EutN
MAGELTVTEPALGIVELSSIARGVVAADAAVKRAPVRILQSHPISPGKYVIVMWGGVAEVEESMGAALAVAASATVDKLFLPQAHHELAPLIERASPLNGAPILAGEGPDTDSVALVETCTICATVLAADAAAKAAAVTLLDLRLGQGIGGKGFFTMNGDLESIEAAAAAAQGILDPSLLVGVEIIPAPHADLRRRLMW